MAGPRPDSVRPAGILLSLVLSFLALADSARAQSFGLSLPETPLDFVLTSDKSEPARESLLPEPVPAPQFIALDDEQYQESNFDDPSFFDTACESLFGDAYAEGRWRPLTFGSFLSDGWREPWAGAPAGRDGLTPRHGWLASFDGVFYRLWLATYGYSNDISTAFGGNRSVGTYSIFLPLSRRFEVLVDVPFVTSNRSPDAPHHYVSQFGDFSVTPRFLLSETAATSQTFALTVRTPTGAPATGGGITALTPRYEFWTNPGGAWVVRGAGGLFFPVAQSGTNVPNAFTGGLAVGRYLSGHDAPLGDLVLYCESNILAPLGGGNFSQTVVSVGPGTRFHLANKYFFLADIDFPVSNTKPADYTLQVALLKVF